MTSDDMKEGGADTDWKIKEFKAERVTVVVWYVMCTWAQAKHKRS